MVDLALLQSVSYIAGALGVCVAATYYVINLRETNRNRRLTLTTNLIQPIITKTTWNDFLELIEMNWTDLDDFKKKYDSRVNPDNFAKRMSIWSYCSLMGELYREGFIDLQRYNSSYTIVRAMWMKFKPIIEMYRGNDFPVNAFSDFQIFAEKLIDYYGDRR
jgi:hypothetical protein